MDLTSLGLEGITRQEFGRLAKQWDFANHGDDAVQLFRISKPLVYGCYEDIIEDFLETEFAYGIRVNNNGKWVGYKAELIIPNGEIQSIAAIAEDDRFQCFHFELKFSKLAKLNHELASANCAHICFARIGRVIVSYEARIPPAVADLFNLNGGLYNHALLDRISASGAQEHYLMPQTPSSTP